MTTDGGIAPPTSQQQSHRQGSSSSSITLPSRRRQQHQHQHQQSSSAAVAPSAPKRYLLRVRIKRFHGVARWTWNAGDDDEVCGICQSAFEGVAPGVKYPGDECPVVWGKCGHAFHLQCVSQWLNSSRNTCPMCRREWEFNKAEDPSTAA